VAKTLWNHLLLRDGIFKKPLQTLLLGDKGETNIDGIIVAASVSKSTTKLVNKYW